jgi:hypothetical protein
MVQVRPLIIAILQNFAVTETRKALRLIVAWGVRFLVHGGLGGGVLEDNYCERARAINAGAIKSAKQLAQAMVDVVPSDKAFELAFAAASVNQTYLARYYLRVLERQARGEAQPELVPNASEDEVTLEHILPLNPEQNWPEFDDDAVRSMRRRLGNLVLLRQKLNSTLRNAAFSKKRGALASSHFSLTREVSKAATWNAKGIVARQERLARLAVSAWPIR